MSIELLTDMFYDEAEIQALADSAPSDMIEEIEYVHHDGSRYVRRILPVRVIYGHNDHHVDDQWFLEAWDYDDSRVRHLAIGHIQHWPLAG